MTSVLTLFLFISSISASTSIAPKPHVNDCVLALSLTGRIPQNDRFWDTLALRYRYRNLLTEHFNTRNITVGETQMRAVNGYLNTILPLSGRWARMTWHTAFDRGVAAVFNPFTRRLEFKTSFLRGIAGVYNPITNNVEWQSEYQSGVAGVFNPITGAVEWQSSYRRGVAGVFNPATGTIEWRTTNALQGLAGALNPFTGLVEWRTVPDRNSIAGALEVRNLPMPGSEY